MPIARAGGQRKRFCGATCRHRHWAATKPGKAKGVAAAESRVGQAARTARLEELYERLSADIDKYGTLIDTPTGLKANPSLAGLLRVNADLNRFAPVADEQEEPDVVASLHAI